MSPKEWTFNFTNDILIYKLEKNEWKIVPNEAVYLDAKELTLDPKGAFPLDRRSISVLPDVKLDQSTDLRIIIIFHEKTPEKEAQTKGAFIDLTLNP